MGKVVLVGCGNVGMSFAFSLVASRNKVSEIVLIDIDEKRADGEAQDLLHASTYSTNRLKIKAGDYSDCHNADIVCICAGVAQKKGETRADLLKRNYNVMKSIVDEIAKTTFDGIYVIATNPVDVMTYAVWQLSGFPHGRVIGSGTTLDTARLRHMIGEELDIHPKNIHSYVIGEHGDTSFIPWSCSVIGLNKARNFLDDDACSRILYKVRTSAYDIINKKGSTYYGIGICLKDIVDSILGDSKSIKTISAYLPDYDVFMGMPTILCAEGATTTFDLELDNLEKDRYDKTIKQIRKMIREMMK
ncbi:MAG: L-lactate dehydrogenase [Firmicutes bacterium]|nr:L-lactate dehydrogenase [Bacillota bacterium]